MPSVVRTGSWLPALLMAAASCTIGPREVLSSDAPQEVADAYCNQMFDCDCGNGRLFTNVSECRNDTESRIQAAIDDGNNAGLQYDPTCLGDFVDTVEDGGCDSTYDEPDDCRPPCNLFYGGRRIGETCSLVGDSMHDCAKGLACDGTCYAPCGDAAQRGSSCTSRPCDEGLFCDFDQVCSELPGVGEACPNDRCVEGAFCGMPDPMDPSIRECILLRANGDPCSGHLQCQSQYCPVGSCATLPNRNEPCPAELCADGLVCQNEVCVGGEAAICFLSSPY